MSVEALQLTVTWVGSGRVAVSPVGTDGACVSDELVVVTTNCGGFVPSLLDIASPVGLPDSSAKLTMPPALTAEVTSNVTHVLACTFADVASSAPTAGALLSVIVFSTQLLSATA